jgi:CubicO group peptidase (beta-lactamase class C family)
VTIHHLLTYTHGITGTGKPLAFKPGSQFSYSQLGYELLAQVAEKTSGKTFAELSTELFRNCGMNHTSHPDVNKSQLVKAYTGDPGEQPVLETNSFENHVAAGGFISTAGDLLLWNECLFGGKLLKPATLKLMTSAQPNAVRQHPIFGATNYGYGITVTNDHGLLQLGQTGFAPGFMSMDFYFPGTGTSVVVLQNILYDGSDVKKISCFHTAILKIIKESLLKKETQ